MPMWVGTWRGDEGCYYVRCAKGAGLRVLGGVVREGGREGVREW